MLHIPLGPDVFDPTHFTPAQAAGRHACGYLPFGAGPRAGIGQHFALQEALLVIGMVAQRYRLHLGMCQNWEYVISLRRSKVG
jgi:cytochrome P450